MLVVIEGVSGKLFCWDWYVMAVGLEEMILEFVVLGWLLRW